MIAARLAFVSLVAACGSSPPPPPAASAPSTAAAAPTAAADLAPALAPLAWLVGDWQSDVGSEHWHAVGGALWGIGLARDGGFEVMAIDAAPSGTATFHAMPGGAREVAFAATTADATHAVFSNPAHDAPKTITYERRGADLRATLDAGTPGALTFDFTPRALPPAPALLAADRAWLADLTARGVDGVLAHLAPDARMLPPGGAALTDAALRDHWTGLLAAGSVTWTPTASGATTRIGFTAGTGRFTPRAGGAANDFAYVTIWRPDPDGTWKVAFDAFR